MLAHAKLDAECCRIERHPSRLGTDWSDHSSGSCGPEDRAGNQDLAFAHNTKDVYFSRSCRMTDLGNRGPTRATRGDIDRWTRVKARLRAELGEKVFSSWFGSIELDRIHDTTVHLTVPTKFLKGWIQTHYADWAKPIYCRASLG